MIEIPVNPDLIVGAAWQSSAWLLAGLVGARLLDRRPARAHAVLLFAAVAAVATPVLTVLFGELGWGLFESRGFSTRARTDLPATFDTFAAVADGINWWYWAVGIWFGVACLLLVRFLVSIGRATQIVRRSVSIDGGPVVATLNRAIEHAGTGHDVLVRTSDETAGPMIWCWGLRPTIVLPVDGSDRCATIGVICHELAHWRRRDHIAALIGELIVIALPWNPLAWASRSRLGDLSERACDAWALEAGEGAADYAQTLVGLAPVRLATVPAAGGRGSALRQRVQRILEDRNTNPRAGRGWTLGVGAAVVAGCAMVAMSQERAPDITRHAAEHHDESPDLDGLLVGDTLATDLAGVVSPDRIDFGVVGASCTGLKQLYVFNKGDEPIEILDVVSSCACTQIEGFKPGMLESGGMMTIDVYMTAPNEAGVEWSRYVLVKIKGQPTLKLPVKIQTDGMDC